ncbi:MAG: GntR family transcriptional regulator [Desulfotignum sp.]|nr:GntR family transcriptional regulator [Desulfotignum sp.]MCF8086933.1 GntR family transcriptional regulator [Desulfotignum sp.]MCF8137205.1 GntR family transcriptional regulator [Desulfotignum sp.]
MGLSKIRKSEPLAKTALKVLRRSILTNELKTDVVYNEKSLASDLGISRTPVREALLELSSKRLVKFLPQKGVVINTFSDKEIEDVFEIRTALEVFAIKKACLVCGPEDIACITRLMDEQKAAAKARDAVTFMEADRAFHIFFIQLTDNEYLTEMMQDIRDIMHLMGFKALSRENRLQEVIQEHEAVLTAVKNRNAAEAAARMETHLTYSRQAVKQSKQEETTHGETGN